MSKYFNYLFKTFLMKKYSYIFLFFGVILYLVFSLIQTFSANSDNISYLKSTKTFDVYPLFIMMVLYTCLICIHCLKEPQEDGTELIFSSSALSRIKLIFIKFIVIFLFILFFQIINFTFYWIVAFADQKSNVIDKILYVFSLLIGGLLVQLFCSFLIAFLSLILSKAATLTISILTAALIPILSIFMGILGNGNSVNFKQVNNPLFLTRVNIKSEKEFENAQEKLASKKKFIHYYDGSTTNIDDIYNEYKENKWYQNFAFIDSYQQFNSLFKIFVVPNYYDKYAINDWKRVYKKPLYSEKLEHEFYIGDLNNKKQYASLLTTKNELFENAFSNKKYDFKKDVLGAAQKLNNIFKNNSDIKAEFIRSNIIRRLLLTKHLINNLELSDNLLTQTIKEFQNDLKDNLAYDSIATMHKIEPISVLTYQYLLNNFDKSLGDSIGGITDLATNTQIIIGNIGIFNGKNKLTNYYPSNFVPIYLVIIFWSTISLILGCLTIGIYLRKDFS